MKIRILKDALALYVQENTDWNGNYFGDDYWEQVMKRIAGKTIEVDTEVLFKYEYNTVPIDGISEDGIRVTEEYVEEIIDDVRHGKAYCELCNETSNSIRVCNHCGKSDYLEPYFDE